MEENKEKKRQTADSFNEKISKIEKEIEDTERKITTLKKNRKALLAELKACKDEQILFIVKSSNLSIEKIMESVKLANAMQQSGISTEDVQGFTKEEIEELVKEDSSNIFGLNFVNGGEDNV